jgi:hypothetical protein
LIDNSWGKKRRSERFYVDQLLHRSEPLIDNSWGKKEEMTDFTLISYSTALHALN